MSSNYQQQKPTVKNTKKDSADHIVIIAKRQRQMIFLFFLYYLSLVPAQINPLLQLLTVPLLVAFTIFNIRLAWVLYGAFGKVFFSVFSFIPFINLFTTLFVTNSANKRLKKYGIKVGLFGAKKKSIEMFCSSSDLV